jgi:hypothetical protein
MRNVGGGMVVEELGLGYMTGLKGRSKILARKFGFVSLNKLFK